VGALIGIGYEGRAVAPFVEDLVARGVTRVVDVRLNPVSRKPGFSKRALAAALADAGIAYEHQPALGNPRENRPGFGGGPRELAAARAAYGLLLSAPAAVAALADLARAAARERVAVLCFEADQRRCHRDVLIANLADGGDGQEP
jgi:uncharacterized protein (DUF488 family)